ncbi:MAG: hypothetical protein R3213_08285 [Flavobacteriaceae bacterium]|nr:hypothetical protein [Flavobacteriaceae bacterium]
MEGFEDLKTEYNSTMIVDGIPLPDLSKLKGDVILFDRLGTCVGTWLEVESFQIEIDCSSFHDDYFFGFYFPFPIEWLEYRRGDEMVKRWESPEKEFYVDPQKGRVLPWKKEYVKQGKFVAKVFTGDDRKNPKLTFATLNIKLIIFEAWAESKNDKKIPIILPCIFKVGIRNK